MKSRAWFALFTIASCLMWFYHLTHLYGSSEADNHLVETKLKSQGQHHSNTDLSQQLHTISTKTKQNDQEEIPINSNYSNYDDAKLNHDTHSEEKSRPNHHSALHHSTEMPLPIDDDDTNHIIDDDQKLLNLRNRCGNKLLIVNIHVPKTGGTSVANALDKCSRKNKKVFLHGHKGDFFHSSHEYRQRVMAIDAHMGYGMHLQDGFPEDRRNCTVYISMVRPYADIIQSSYRYNMIFFILPWYKKHTDDASSLTRQTTTPKQLSEMQQLYLETVTESKSFIHPWLFQGSATYQFCCFHDYQHPESRMRGNTMNLIWSDNKMEYAERNFKDIDPNCPTHEERLQCAMKRLCHDFSIVGDITNKASIDEFFRRLGLLMGCDLSAFATRKANPSSWPPYDSFSDELLSTVSATSGAQVDKKIMEFGIQMTQRKEEICHDF